jgi:branched-subunit amino acid ABC-type transport system permease component
MTFHAILFHLAVALGLALISAIGKSICLQNWVALGQGARDMAVPSLLPGAINFHMGDFEVFIPYTRVLIIAVTVVLMIALYLGVWFWLRETAARIPARSTWASTAASFDAA